MAGRVDLEHVERDANSLKRYGDVNGFEDLADFAALTLALVAELRVAREVAEADRWLSESATPERIMRLNRAKVAYREWCDQATARPDPAAGHADPDPCAAGHVWGATSCPRCGAALPMPDDHP